MTLSPRGAQLLNAVRMNFELLKEHDKASHYDVDAIVAAMVQHIRAFRPLLLNVATAPEIDHAG